MQVVVYGLWHLGCVTAACLAAAGQRVIGLDRDPKVVEQLNRGQAPLHEPGLNDLIASGLASRQLAFTSDPAAALNNADVVWIAFDTPVNDEDEADVAYVRGELEAVAAWIPPGSLVLTSAQVPVGFTHSLEQTLPVDGLRCAYSPENLRLGNALKSFQSPERVVVGIRAETDKPKLQALFAPFCQRIEWMSVESAEMTKHALNAFLATSVTFINELSRICEAVGADAKEVERGLKSEGRIGPRAYLAPGAAFAGGTLARDLGFLIHLGEQHQVGTPFFEGVKTSNIVHKNWVRDNVRRLLGPVAQPVVAVLGLTYKPGTSTLRRSTAVELCSWLSTAGIGVRAHDPAVDRLPGELESVMTLCATPAEALRGSDVAVIATEWPIYRSLRAGQLLDWMRRPQVVDPNHFLADSMAEDTQITYIATGRKRGAA